MGEIPDDERTEVRIKVRVPGEPIQWVVEDGEGVDIHPSADMASLYGSVEQAMERVEELAGDFPDATLSVIEEGWTGDWSGLTAAHAAFWRHQ